ncbi:hypothetical protein FA13DRAFT_1732019 [Coprinellus micaceus]|uniref:Transcription initiation factor TFIID subunit 4 n=1 Tax=Coprinellus micaceus TaxID=71717 RepID=A0A4Y7TFG1_COPMI|nr:hypothetical protein FA13DRAFT_1732019 [Coprinellus micaceus]
MSTPAVKQDPDAATTSQAPATTSVPPMTSAAPTPVSVVAAGTPVQTYPSPAHAQWAAQMVIDPQLQQQAANTGSTTPKPLTAQVTVPTTQQPQASQYYATAYQHYPYYQQYLANYSTQQQQHAAATAAHAHSSTPVTTRTSFSVATTPAPPTPVVAAYTPAAVATATAAAAQAAQSSNLDTNDIATLNDALGSAGVDLRAEEESLQRQDASSHLQSTSSLYMQNRQYEDRSRKQPIKPAFNTVNLGTTMRTIGTEHKVTRIPEDSINYMALALKARLQDLIEAMIEASRYRKEAQFDRPANFYESLQPGATQGETPMWSIMVRSDVAKQLAVLERIEREDETRIRRERKERLELQTQHAASLAAQADGGAMMGITGTGGAVGVMGMSNGMGAMEDEQPKKKKKKDGPGVTARNLSEDVRKKMSNAVATQAAGLGKYSWMTASASTPAPKKAAAASTPGANANGGAGGGPSAWARPYVPKKPQQAQPATTGTEIEEPKEDPSKITVTMRDAMFVIEKERGHGAGKGAARGWR